MNSHYRLKHSKAEIAQNQPLEYTIELYDTLNDQPSNSARTSTFTHQIDNENFSTKSYKSVEIEHMDKRKHRQNNQQIIYVMPGPMN